MIMLCRYFFALGSRMIRIFKKCLGIVLESPKFYILIRNFCFQSNLEKLGQITILMSTPI